MKWALPTCFMAMLLGFSIAAGSLHADTILRRGNHDEPESLDPQKTSGAEEQWIQEDIFIGLTRYNPEGKLVPDLARSWDVSADGLTWVFHLRDGIRWSDGQPLTAADFVWSFQRAVDPKTAAQYVSVLFPITNAEAINNGAEPDLTKLGVSAPDPQTLVFHLDAPTPYLPGILAISVSYPLPRAAIEKYGDAWTKPGHLVASGAFNLTEWVPQDHITLMRNPEYYDAASVKLDAVTWFVISDDDTALRSFRNGELDIGRLAIKQVPWARKFMPATLHTAQLLWTNYLIANLEHPPLNDARIRQAISLMIDRNTIVTKVTPHGQIPALSLVPPGMEGYTSALPDWAGLSNDARHAKAQELLNAAGYGPEKRLAITVMYPAYEERKHELSAIAAMVKPIGIDLSFDPQETQVALGDLHHHNFDLCYYSWIADYPDPWTFLSNFLSNATDLNVANYRNPAYDALLVEASKPMSAGARLKLLAAAETLIMRDQPIIPIEFNNSPYMVSATLHGYVENAVDRHRSADMSFGP